MTIDYKSLLKKYIRHVRECEGIDFVSDINEEYMSEVEFTDDEKAEMKKLSGEVWEDE